jgi:hypothetical protein
MTECHAVRVDTIANPFSFPERNPMKSRHLPILLLTAAIGCTQGGAPPAEVDVVVQGTPGAGLPAATATMIRFTCPGMT